MRPVFDRLYLDQLSAYSQWNRSGADYFLQPTATQALRMVEAALDNALEKYPQATLRADARLFAILNLHQMVALPLTHPGALPEIRQETLNSDAATVIGAAVANSKSQIVLISAADLLRAASSSLNRLSLKDFRIWDHDE